MAKIKNWNQFQHFKNRKPKWIKLYRDILYQRDVNLISDSDFRILVYLWLLAADDSKMEGNLPALPDIAFALRRDEKSISVAMSRLSDFLILDDNELISERYQDDIKVISDGYQPDIKPYQNDIPEKRREEKRREENENINLISKRYQPDIKLISESWNSLGSPFKQIRSFTAKRKTALRARHKDEFWRDNWELALDKMHRSSFCRGETASGDWVADIDWFLKPDSVAKLIEGKYDDRGGWQSKSAADIPDDSDLWEMTENAETETDDQRHNDDQGNGDT